MKRTMHSRMNTDLAHPTSEFRIVGPDSEPPSSAGGRSHSLTVGVSWCRLWCRLTPPWCLMNNDISEASTTRSKAFTTYSLVGAASIPFLGTGDMDALYVASHEGRSLARPVTFAVVAAYAVTAAQDNAFKAGDLAEHSKLTEMQDRAGAHR
jgi:hypothetical protein